MGRGERSWALRGGLRAEGLGSPRRHALRPLGGGLGWKRPSGKVPLQGAGPLRPSHVLRATSQGSQRVLGKPLVPRRPWILGRVEPNEGAWRGLSSGSPAPPCLPPASALDPDPRGRGPSGASLPLRPQRRPEASRELGREALPSCPAPEPAGWQVDNILGLPPTGWELGRGGDPPSWVSAPVFLLGAGSSYALVSWTSLIWIMSNSGRFILLKWPPGFPRLSCLVIQTFNNSHSQPNAVFIFYIRPMCFCGSIWFFFFFFLGNPQGSEIKPRLGWEERERARPWPLCSSGLGLMFSAAWFIY